MGLLDTATGAFTSLDDYVGDFFTSFSPDFLTSGQTSFMSDVLGGAVTGGAIAAISGGDIGEAALYGGIGGSMNDSNFGQYGNEIGGAIQGYGVGGVGGAVGGGLSAYAKDSGAFSGNGSEDNNSSGEQVDASQVGANGGLPVNQVSEGGGGLLADKLKSFGLMKDNGDGTLLGKGLIAGIGNMASEASQNDMMDKKQKIEEENYRNRARIDDEQEQRRIGAFSNQPTFKVQRNG